jgi:hypothetical protein
VLPKLAYLTLCRSIQLLMFLDCQLVVPAANVLDEDVSGDHDPGAVLLPEPNHGRSLALRRP